MEKEGRQEFRSLHVRGKLIALKKTCSIYNTYIFLIFFSDLLHCTEEPNVSIPTLANLLIERTQSQNWITVFKGLVTLHHMMCYGNERFIQYLGPDFVF